MKHLHIAVTLALAAATACAKQPTAVTLNQNFDLQSGRNASVSGADKVTVTLVQVSGDSRCATDVQCVWAGDATVKLDLSVGSQAHAVTDLHTNAQSGPTTLVLNGYTVRLVDLLPYPKSGQVIAQGEYVAKLEVTK
jgi:hypothetical protein